MSTKSTISHGPNYHFYEEALDSNFVYLQLENIPFETTNNEVTVSIPLDVWEVIRKHAVADLSLAGLTDADLDKKVEEAVDTRILRYQEAPLNRKSLAVLMGALVYGSADLPRDEQVHTGLKYHYMLRAEQEKVSRAIAALEALNAPIKSD